MKFNFIGPTYASRSLNADCQRTINLYPELVESGGGKNRVVLYGTPGLSAPFATLADVPVRSLFSGNGRAFAIGGGTFYELLKDGTVTRRGALSRNGQSNIVSNGVQLFVSSGDQGYIYDLGKNTLTATISSRRGAFIDGYFISMQPNSQQFNISALYDGMTFDGLDFASAEGAPDNLTSILADHRELWLFGDETTEVWFNSGNPDFPFERIPGAFVEAGCAAGESPAKAGRSVLWIGKDPRGAGICWRAQGYTEERVSNHAVEFAWSQYARIDDAIGYCHQEAGHIFYVVYFPTADATWAFDLATGMWHERAWWDKIHGRYTAHRARCHAFGFGKHLVGDKDNGNVYDLRPDVYTDNGDEIRRVRRTPHVSNEQTWIWYDQFQLDLEVGVGLDAGVQGSNPQVMLRWSDDGAKTWSNEYWTSAGPMGEYRRRAIWRRLGRARDRVYEVMISDPVKVALVDAYLRATAGRS